MDEVNQVKTNDSYGQSKLIFRQILKLWSHSLCTRRALHTQYFNPLGAHVTGLIGENPIDTPNNLVPYSL